MNRLSSTSMQMRGYTKLVEYTLINVLTVAITLINEPLILAQC